MVVFKERNMKKILIVSIIMNLFLVSILLYILNQNNESYSSSVISTEIGAKNFRTFFSTYQLTDEADDFFDLDLKEYENDPSYMLLKKLLNIEDDTVAQYDWLVINDVILNQNCSKRNMRPDDYTICTLLKSKDLNQLKTYDYDSDVKKNIINSALEDTNMCWEDEECNMIWDTIQWVKNKNLAFPDLKTDYKILDLYAYKQLFPDNYEIELLNWFQKTFQND